MFWIVALVSISTLVYYFIHLNHQYWTKRGIKGPKPTFLLGNLRDAFLLKKQPGEVYTDIYRTFDEPVVGLFRAESPTLLIRDIDLIKEITIKSFSHFKDNDIDIDKNGDPLFGRNPFVLKGDEWKSVRAQVTPCFTSGKMKYLYSYMEENSKKMVEFIKQIGDQSYEAKELCIRFTLNNVGDSVFGIEAKCFEEDKSEFRQLARDFLSPGSWSMILFFLVTIFPPIGKVFSLRLTPKKVEKQLTEIVSQSLKYRQDNNIVRSDFLHFLNQLKNSSNFTDVDVTAHAAGFFADGSETSSLVMGFVLFHLASNAEIQKKLRKEIEQAFEENNNLPYEVVQSLTYLEAVISETLRINPAIYHLQKTCTETCTLKKDSKEIVIDKGTPIILPIYALHNDPKYFENPEVFNPERFLGDNKEKLLKGTYLPFGDGPRACLGQRFGLLQIKVGVAYIIKNFELGVDKKTQLPLKFDPTMVLVTPIGGLWLNFKKIK